MVHVENNEHTHLWCWAPAPVLCSAMTLSSCWTACLRAAIMRQAWA